MSAHRLRDLASGIALLCAFALASVARAQAPAVAPRSPDDALAAFVLADPALVIELVAAEPDVTSPVAIAWDESGRLYVAEMLDYPVATRRGESGGSRIATVMAATNVRPCSPRDCLSRTA